MAKDQAVNQHRHTHIGLGLMGCASIAQRRTLPALQSEKSLELVAVASRDPAKALAVTSQYGGASVRGYGALLRRRDVDAVYIPLPAGMHAEWIERALLADKHVLAEKPLTIDPDTSARLLTLAADRGLVLMENLTFLRHPVHGRVQELLDGGAIGELRAVEAAFAFPPLPPNDIRYSLELGGGALFDVGPYPVSTARCFLGSDVTVVGATLKHHRGGVDVSGAALLKDGDRTAHLTFGFEHSYRSYYRLWGSHGHLTVDRAYTPPPTWESTIMIQHEKKVHEEKIIPYDQFRLSLREFADAIVAGIPSLTYTDKSVLAQAKLLAQILSAAEGRECAPTSRGAAG